MYRAPAPDETMITPQVLDNWSRYLSELSLKMDCKECETTTAKDRLTVLEIAVYLHDQQRIMQRDSRNSFWLGVIVSLAGVVCLGAVGWIKLHFG